MSKRTKSKTKKKLGRPFAKIRRYGVNKRGGYCYCGCGAKTQLCTKSDSARGRIVNTYTRYLPGHSQRVHVKNMTDKMIGKKFSKLTVIGKAGSDSEGHKLYLLRCECSNLTVAPRRSLRSGAVQSCGCARRSQPINFAELARAAGAL